MKILLTNHDLDYYAGTETFIYALATELSRRGHDVICFSPRLGAVAQRLAGSDITVTRDLCEVPDDIDVIHAQHRYESLLAAARFPDVPIVFVCHGLLPWQEQPMADALELRHYVAVSEEVSDHLQQRHGVPEGDVTIIRNGLDLHRFRSRSPIAPHPRRALILSNYMPAAQREQVRRVCGHLDITVAEIGDRTARWEVEEEINAADLVFALGRSALEAMACRRVVIVYDYNGGDGLVTPDRFERQRERNFSGRTEARQFTDTDLAAEIAGYTPDIADRIHPFIERDHDIRGMAERYLGLYEAAQGGVAPAAPSRRDLAIQHYRTMRLVLDEAATLRSSANQAEDTLRDIRQSRFWRAAGVYQKLKGGLRLPRRRPAEDQPRPRVLVIDDDPLIGQWLTDALSAQGHVVEAVDSGEAALERLRSAVFDVVLADLNMSGVDGIDVYEALKRTRPQMADRVIFVTGHASEPRYRQFLARHQGRNLSKPFDMHELSRLIRLRLDPTPH